MKYKEGDIVLLSNGKSVYVLEIDKNKNEYQVAEIDNENEMYMVDENEIFMLVTG